MYKVNRKIEGNARSKHSYMPHVERSLMHCGRSTGCDGGVWDGYLIEILLEWVEQSHAASTRQMYSSHGRSLVLRSPCLNNNF